MVPPLAGSLLGCRFPRASMGRLKNSSQSWVILIGTKPTTRPTSSSLAKLRGFDESQYQPISAPGVWMSVDCLVTSVRYQLPLLLSSFSLPVLLSLSLTVLSSFDCAFDCPFTAVVFSYCLSSSGLLASAPSTRN